MRFSSNVYSGEKIVDFAGLRERCSHEHLNEWRANSCDIFSFRYLDW